MLLSRSGLTLVLQLLQSADDAEASVARLDHVINAASYGYIDDVIEPRNTRFRIIRALEQLKNKRQTTPAKKHGNIPL